MTRTAAEPTSRHPLATEVANARVRLALLRMFEKVPCAENIEYNYGSIAEVFWPVVRRYPSELRSSLRRWSSHRGAMKPQKKRGYGSRLELLNGTSMPEWLPNFLDATRR